MPRFCKDLFDNLEKIEKILPQLWSDSLHRFSLVCMKSIMIRLGISSTLQMGKAFGDIIMPPPLFISNVALSFLVNARISSLISPSWGS